MNSADDQRHLGATELGEQLMTENKRANLGRGLAALLGDDDVAEAAVGERQEGDSAAPNKASERVPVTRLTSNPYQPRQDFDEDAISALAESVSEKGILQPLLVREAGDNSDKTHYEIVAGERRWRAAQRAGLEEVPVIVRSLSDTAALEIAIVENVQRRDLTPLEEALGYQRLMAEFDHSQEDLARVVGKSRSHIANMLRLLQLPDGVKTRVQAGDIAAGHARALLNADDPEALADEVAQRRLSVRETEKLAEDVKAAERGETPRTNGGQARRSSAKDGNLKTLEETVSTELGLKVRIASKGQGGTVTLHYSSPEQRDDMLHRLRYGPDRTDPSIS